MKDDLISRQAAIEAIKEFQRGAAEWRDEQEERSDIWHRADSAIASAIEIGLRVKKLPSAQPEKCVDCANFNKTMLLIPQGGTQWIPCSERLPERNQICIVTDETRRCAYEYGFHDETYDKETGWTYLGHRIIAWMPLPEPYKAESED